MDGGIVDLLSGPERGLLLRQAATCAFLGVAAGPLGCVLLVRRTALMADALAHGLLPGVGLAWLLWGAGLSGLAIGGLVAGVATALAAALVARMTRLAEDAAFAAVLSTCFALGVLLVSATATPVDLLGLLFGRVVAIGSAELRLAAATSAAVVLFLGVFHRSVLLECFDRGYHRAIGGASATTHVALLALVVLALVCALQAVGVVLALGFFVLPAATARLWTERWGAMLALAAAIAVAGALGGFLLSLRTGMASGASIVATLGAGFACSVLLSPRHGLLARLLPPARAHHREDDDEECRLPPARG